MVNARRRERLDLELLGEPAVAADIARIAVDTAGNAMVMWPESTGIYSARYSAASAAWALPTKVTADDGQVGGLAADAQGNVTAVWQRWVVRGVSSSVHSARFDAETETWGAVSEQVGVVAGVGIDASNPPRLFAFTDNFGVALSQDGGKTWRARNRGVRLSQGEFIFAFAFDPNNSSHIYAATPEQIFRSTDAGENWEKIL